MKATLDTIRWLSIFTGALSLFYLGHAWFEFGLGEVFTRIYSWYAGILHPIVGLIEPIVRAVLGLLGWSPPDWWKDCVVLYFTWLGAMARALESNPDLPRERLVIFVVAVPEFVKILIGALTFAGLNAGLG